MARNEWQDWINSPFYDKLYRSSSPVATSGVILHAIHKLALPADARILVAGCGTGADCAVVSASGYDVTGTDYSPSIIDQTKDLETPTLHFYQHDHRLPFWSNYFRFAVITAAAFGHYDTHREQMNVLRTIAGSLTPGASLLIDYPSTAYHEQHPDRDSGLSVEGTEFSLRHSSDEAHFITTITVTDPSLAAPLKFVKRKQKLRAEDFTDMLEQQGLIVEQTTGDYDGADYDTGSSPRIIMLAKKQAMEKQDAEKRLYSDGRTGDALT